LLTNSNADEKFPHGLAGLADKLSMAFNITIAFTITVVAIHSLVYLSMRNKRAGWRRERSNTLLDTLIAWANANTEMRWTQERTKSIVTTRGTSVEPELLTQQLSALQLALNVNAGTTPGLHPVLDSAATRENFEALVKLR
jgi:hypothetical protein